MYDFKKIEEEARKVWKKYSKEIKQAIQEENTENKPLFSFLEGPPTANAPPALHHLEVRTFKDIICKYKFMQGFHVPRKGGWDCHGLPVEVQVEKALKLNSKKDILKYGQNKFIEDCKKSVFSNIQEWNKSTEELDYWVDLDKPYRTLDNNYVESVWWSLKELYNKKLLYEGYKVVPFCPRCSTPLSSHEVSQGYKDVKEESVYIAFKLKQEKEYILAWTTTPWTLPGNVALAVGPKIDYVKIELSDGDKLILGKEKLDLIKGDYKILKKMKGKELVGLEYQPLFDIPESKNENSHKVIQADFVTIEDGTGIVHIAVMYGEDDYHAGKLASLPEVHTVGQDGRFLDIVPKFLRGKFVKSAEKDIIEDLKKRHLIFKTKKFSHTYPFCWRCSSPLLYYGIDSWFVKTTAVKDKMIKLNQEINWLPKHIKDGRFGMWLENIKDWNLSRLKFWGTPLPVWRCECGNEKIIGSVKELKENSIEKFAEYDLHRPWIDNIKFKCECGKKMTRVKDVIDCWYDSGSATFAQFHYPFENKELFEKRFPYDFISEAIDQTRGWFYTLHALSTILFGKVAYKNCISAGLILDGNGEKMSKSKGNILNPREIIDEVGVDAVRMQMCINDPGNSKRYSIQMMRETVLPFLNVLYNIKNYYSQLENKTFEKRIEDDWIISRLNSVIKEASEYLDKLNIDKAMTAIMEFVVSDFSRTYIRITRERNDIRIIVGEILEKISILLSPYAPYISESIYQSFNKNKSVHFSSWPKFEKNLVNEKLEKEFVLVFESIEKGLRERDRAHIGLRWPLAKAKIFIKEKIEIKKFEEIIKKQLNVKKIELKIDNTIQETAVKLDTKLTPELEEEGYARELSRKVQSFRKELGLEKKDRIELFIFVEEEFRKSLEKQKIVLKERTNSKKLEIFSNNVMTDKERFKNKTSFKIKNKKGEIVVIY